MRANIPKELFLVPPLPPSGKQFITRQEWEEGRKTDGEQRVSFAR